MKQISNRGSTLIEILLAVAILAIALCAILGAYISCFVLMATSKNINIATNVALGLMEDIRSAPFTDLSGADLVINNQPFEQLSTHLYRCRFSVGVLPTNKIVVYMNDTNPDLLELTISICWRQGGRVIGEDTDLDGVLDAGEDKSSPPNGIIDSPVELVTRIANR